MASRLIKHDGLLHHSAVANEASWRKAVYFYPSLLKSKSTGEIPAWPRHWGTSFAKLGKQRALQKFLIPIDGSSASIRAVEYAIRHAGEGVKVHLINVQPVIRVGDVSFFTSANMVADMRRRAGEHALSAAKALLDTHRIEYTAEVVFGSPAKAILRCAAEQRCTKIVMGTKGRSLLGNLVARSVANRVVRRARVPVTLIKETSSPAFLEHLVSTDARRLTRETGS